MSDLRHYLLILAFGLWMGGFTFYAVFVIPTNHEVLGDHFIGGLITRGVTNSLNQVGIVAIGLMLWEVLASWRSTSRWPAMIMLSLWICVVLSHIGLFVVHWRLDAVIDLQNQAVSDRPAFRSLHRNYNQLSAVQWFACLAFLALSLRSWRQTPAPGTTAPGQTT